MHVFPAAAAIALLCTSVPRAAPGADLDLRGSLRNSLLSWHPALPEGGNAGKASTDDLLNLRQQLRLYSTGLLSLGLDLEILAAAGESAPQLLQNAGGGSVGERLLDLDLTLVERDNFVLQSLLDRAWVDFCTENMQLTAGRQRIAWGTCLVWNPSDIFNPGSPLDFDDLERPGTDALRLQLYTGPVSTFEGTVAPGRRAGETVAALKLGLHRWNTDWRLIAGRRANGALAGFSWAGQLLEGGLRGELLLSIPRRGSFDGDDAACLNGALSADYTFAGGLYLHAEALYNQSGAPGKAGGAWLENALERKLLSAARWNLFAEAVQRLNPLLNGSLGGIFNPGDRSWHLGPSLAWSALENLDITLYSMLFGGRAGSEFGDAGGLHLLRLQWSW